MGRIYHIGTATHMKRKSIRNTKKNRRTDPRKDKEMDPRKWTALDVMEKELRQKIVDSARRGKKTINNQKGKIVNPGATRRGKGLEQGRKGPTPKEEENGKHENSWECRKTPSQRGG